MVIRQSEARGGAGAGQVSRALLLGLALLGLGGCGAPAFTPLDRTAKHVHAGAVAWWYGNDTSSNDVEAKPLAGLIHQKCAVRKMGTEKSEFFVRVAGYADHVITSPAFAAMMKAKTSFELTTDSGEQVMDRLRWPGVDINLIMYERDGDHPCRGDNELVNGHTNAFTPMPDETDVHLLFLYEPYFVEAMKEDAVREVARTVVHESLHSMGYSHAGLAVGSEAYNNTVPLYVGCLIEHWGTKANRAWSKLNCDKADADRTKPPA